MQLLGGPTAQQEKNLDQGFLMDMLDVRERIEEARASGDAVARSAIEADLAARQAERMGEVARQFDRLDELAEGDPARPARLAEIRRGLNAVKTIQSLLRDLRLD